MILLKYYIARGCFPMKRGGGPSAFWGVGENGLL